MPLQNRKTAVMAVFPNSGCFDQAATVRAFRFLRQPSRPNAPRPVAKSGRAAGRGTTPDVATDVSNPPESIPTVAVPLAVTKSPRVGKPSAGMPDINVVA